MNKIVKMTEYKIFTTPDELRRIANKMDRRWAEILVGDSTRTHTWFGEEVCIDLCIDQTAMSVKEEVKK